MSTIKDSAVEHIAVSVKGVTHYNRQDILKHLYDQKLPKEEKHLSLEKYTDGRVETYVVIMNGFKIGTLPQDCLETIFYPAVNYELSNIHIGKMTVENGRIIYYAKLFITLTPVEESQCLPKKKACIECGNEIQELQGLCSDCYKKFKDNSITYSKSLEEFEKQNRVLKTKLFLSETTADINNKKLDDVNRELDDINKENELLLSTLNKTKTENIKIKAKANISKYTPNVIAAILCFIAIVMFFYFQTERAEYAAKYNTLKSDYDYLDNLKIRVNVINYTKTISKNQTLDITLQLSQKADLDFRICNSNLILLKQYNHLDKNEKLSSSGYYEERITIPNDVTPDDYYIEISAGKTILKLPFTIKNK